MSEEDQAPAPEEQPATEDAPPPPEESPPPEVVEAPPEESTSPPPPEVVEPAPDKPPPATPPPPKQSKMDTLSVPGKKSATGKKSASISQKPSATVPQSVSAEAEPSKIPASSSRSTPDPLHAEFLYYTAVLRVLGPTITSEGDRRTIMPWIRKLFRPEYHSSKLRGKRNRYLAFLATSLLLDEAVGVFHMLPPDGAIPDLKTLKAEQLPAADWEVDTTWQDTLGGLPDDFKMLECSVHSDANECKADKNLDKILDQEFQLFLYIAKPYAYLLQNGNDRTRVASWLQMLCSIHGRDSCSSMKAIRNDYMMALLGYLQDLRSVGPFAELPSWKTLSPLAEAAKLASENKPITDPTGVEANEFLMNQPMPDDGAFCYIALTGEMVTSNLIQT